MENWKLYVGSDGNEKMETEKEIDEQSVLTVNRLQSDNIKLGEWRMKLLNTEVGEKLNLINLIIANLGR